MQLIARSMDIVRSQGLAKANQTPYQTFGMPATDQRLSVSAPEIDKNHQTAVHSYRSPSGNIWIKIKSPFGGYQCFEVTEPDPAIELSVGAWMFTRCR